MEPAVIHSPPNRIDDLIKCKQEGQEVTCHPDFQILPVDFTHRAIEYQAHIFLCNFSGTIDQKEYSFRKCYARGCSHNLCPHVSQSTMIANRYLQRDYFKMQAAGIDVEQRLFTAGDMLVKFKEMKGEYGQTLTIHDYINMAKEGIEISIDVELEFVPAVEHFAGFKNSQVFLMATFAVTALGKVSRCERCLSCYEAGKEQEERQLRVQVANERLRLLYEEFDEVSIKYSKRFCEG